MKTSSCVKYIFLFSTCIFILSCSYRFSGEGSLPSGIKRIYFSMIENNTSETGIEHIITNDLINEFIHRRKDVIGRQDDSDGILKGNIEYLRDVPIVHGTQIRSAQRRITLGIALKLTDTKGKAVWIARGINSSEVYRVADDKMSSELNKKTAIQALSRRLAEKVYNRLTDDF